MSCRCPSTTDILISGHAAYCPEYRVQAHRIAERYAAISKQAEWKLEHSEIIDFVAEEFGMDSFEVEEFFNQAMEDENASN